MITVEVPEYTAPEITPELAIEIFGQEAQEPVTRNLTEYCNKWLDIDYSITSLQQFPVSKNEYVRIYIEVTLQHLQKEKYQCERHIKRLQRCLELLTQTNLFPLPSLKAGRVDIAKLKERLDVVAAIGRDVELHQTGNTYKGRCPFHNDRSPSFVVYPEEKRWWCFACSEGGDIISFIQKIRNCSFREAATELERL